MCSDCILSRASLSRTRTEFSPRNTHFKAFLAVSRDRQSFLELETEALGQCAAGTNPVCPLTRPLARKQGRTNCIMALYSIDTEQVSRAFDPAVTAGRDRRQSTKRQGYGPTPCNSQGTCALVVLGKTVTQLIDEDDNRTNQEKTA